MCIGLSLGLLFVLLGCVWLCFDLLFVRYCACLVFRPGGSLVSFGLFSFAFVIVSLCLFWARFCFGFAFVCFGFRWFGLAFTWFGVWWCFVCCLGLLWCLPVGHVFVCICFDVF